MAHVEGCWTKIADHQYVRDRAWKIEGGPRVDRLYWDDKEQKYALELAGKHAGYFESFRKAALFAFGR